MSILHNRLRTKVFRHLGGLYAHVKTNTDGTRVFKSDEYPTLNQIRYRMRKVSQKYGITPQQELIDELTEINVE